jgi:ElaB/YqjD/DUF883 family membrane-anchored ribosome-binding protein
MSAKRLDPDAIDLEFLKSEFNRFRADLGGVKGKLGASATEALDQINDYLNGGGLSSRIATLEEELTQLTGKLKGTGQQAVLKLESGVNQRPILSVALAFGAGILAAQLLRRTSRE